MSEFYTPRTDQVRAVYVLDFEFGQGRGESFDRWLAAEKAGVWYEALAAVGIDESLVNPRNPYDS